MILGTFLFLLNLYNGFSREYIAKTEKYSASIVIYNDSTIFINLLNIENKNIFNGYARFYSNTCELHSVDSILQNSDHFFKLKSRSKGFQLSSHCSIFDTNEIYFSTLFSERIIKPNAVSEIIRQNFLWLHINEYTNLSIPKKIINILEKSELCIYCGYSDNCSIKKIECNKASNLLTLTFIDKDKEVTLALRGYTPNSKY